MIEQLKAEIKEIEKQQHELANRKAELATQLAGLECPFKVGDVGILNGWSHKGKKAQIRTIYSKYGKWVAKAQLFKSNGELGNQYYDFSYDSHFIVERVA